ncbi:MAG: CRISPR-associated endonuclease Cas1 [Desulfurococcaceae archaeon]
MKVFFVKNAVLVTRKSRCSLVIHRRDGSYREVNIRDIEAIIVLGASTRIDCGAIALLSRYNIPLSIVSKIGVSILTVPVVTLYSETRRAQYALSSDEKMEIMLEILKAKFRGFSNILKYHDVMVSEELDSGNVLTSKDLLYWEAALSRMYWQLMLSLIPRNHMNELKNKYGFQGRKPRSKDPFNQSISALYAILYSLSTRALLASGLDPTYGLHHKTRYSTPLTYDYSEMFKPIAIHAVIKTFRKSEKLPELDSKGYLTKESLKTILKEFFNIMKARIRGTRITPHRALYINALRLATRIRTRNKQIHYTYTYNPKKLQHPRNNA